MCCGPIMFFSLLFILINFSRKRGMLTTMQKLASCYMLTLASNAGFSLKYLLCFLPLESVKTFSGPNFDPTYKKGEKVQPLLYISYSRAGCTQNAAITPLTTL